MKRTAILALVLATGMMAGTVYAGCGSCPGDKKTEKKAHAHAKCCGTCEKSSSGCMGKALKGIELSAIQKKKIDKIHADCKKKIQLVLTPKQRKQMKASCEKAKTSCAKPKKKKGC